MYIGPARTTAEMRAAERLAHEVFASSSALAAPEFEEHKSALWDEPDFPGGGHVVVAAPGPDTVHGTIRLLPRTLRHDGQALKVAGISSVCVAEAQRGAGLSRDLMRASMELARELGYELVMLFARRAVDRFYPRFDIWGLASYSTLRIASLGRTGLKDDRSILARPATYDDLPRMAEWHAECYGRCLGYIERSQKQWRFLADQARYRQLSLIVCESPDKDLGYAVVQGNRIVEIGYGEPAHAVALLESVTGSKGGVVVEVSSSHPIIDELQDMDVTISVRVCEYGGHMVGVLDRDAACRRLENRIRRRARALDLRPRVERFDSLVLSWDGTDAVVEVEAAAGDPLGLRTTARLVGSRLGVGHDDSLLAPGEPLDFLALDQF